MCYKCEVHFLRIAINVYDLDPLNQRIESIHFQQFLLISTIIRSIIIMVNAIIPKEHKPI